MDEGQVGRTGPGLATGPSGKTVLVQTQQLSGSFLTKAASNVEEHGAELFISFHHPSEFWPSNADTQNAALWGRGGGLLLKHKPSRRQQLCGQLFQRSFPLCNLIIWGSQSR